MADLDRIPDPFRHPVAKVAELAARERPEPRDLLQLGYNLGRLSELTGLGREPFWDRWKDAVAGWDRDRLARLASDLLDESARWEAPRTLDPPGASTDVA